MARSAGRVVMDLRTKLLLGATALSVIGYFALIYGGCALDEHCHLRLCGRGVCGVIHDADAPPAR
jgi:glutamate synthase domain-containing protein 2